MPFSSKMIIFSSQNCLKKYTTILLVFIYCLIFPFKSEAQLGRSDFSNHNNNETLGKLGYSQPFMQAEKLFHSGKFLAAKPFYHTYLEKF